MLSISIGPVALPVAPLSLLLAVWGASWLAGRLFMRQGGPAADRQAADLAGHTVFVAAALGLLAARLAHLAMNADLYAVSPLSALDLRDGGWHTPAGVIAGGAWLAWRGVRMPPFRRPLAGAAAAGLAAWWAATLLAGGGHGTAMPTVALAALHGGAPMDLRQAAAGRPVVVNLWASWCGPCRAEMPVLAAAQQRETGVRFLFVNQGEPARAVQAWLQREGLPLHDVWLDPASAFGPAVGSRGLPTTLFLDAQGRRVSSHFGQLNAASLQVALQGLRRP